MEFLSDSVDTRTVALVGAIAIIFLLSRLLFKSLSSGVITTVLTVIAIFLILQYVFGVSPKEMWHEVARLPRTLSYSLTQLWRQIT